MSWIWIASALIAGGFVGAIVMALLFMAAVRSAIGRGLNL